MVKKTYDPIKREETYKNGFLPQIPVPEPDCAIVLIARKEGSKMVVIDRESKIKGTEIRKGKYDYLVEIDKHSYNIQIEIKVMSSDQVSYFTVLFSGMAAIKYPDIIYQEQIRDVAQHIENGVLSRLQNLAKKYNISEIDDLSHDIENEFKTPEYIDGGIGVRDISVLVKSDEHYEKLLEEKRKIRYQRELDREKSDAADEARQRFSNPGIASYTEYIDGNVSALEANENMREEMDKNLDLKVRQAEKIIKLGLQLEDEGWIEKEQMKKNAAEVMQNLLSSSESVSDKQRISMNSIDEIEAKEIYRKFED